MKITRESHGPAGAEQLQCIGDVNNPVRILLITLLEELFPVNPPINSQVIDTLFTETPELIHRCFRSGVNFAAACGDPLALVSARAVRLSSLADQAASTAVRVCALSWLAGSGLQQDGGVR
jgi:hypothetical protein